MMRRAVPIQLKNHQDWFTCLKLPGEIYAIREEKHWQNVTSFLICGSHRAILFDTGLGIRDIKKVAEELYDGQITVINSHCHFDHIGNNWRFDKVVVFDDEYAMHTAAAGVPCEMIADQAAEEAFSGGYPEGFSPKDLFCRPYSVSAAQDGDFFNLGDRRLEYIHTPGHSSDCIMLYDRSMGILLAGDMIYHGALYAMFDDTLYGRSDIGQYIDSIQKVAGMCPEIRAIYASHNDCIVEPAMLQKMADAMSGIRQGKAEGITVEREQYGFKKGQLKQYIFDGYSVVCRR